MKLRIPDDSQLISVSNDPEVKKTVYLKSGEVPGILQWARASLKPGYTITEHLHPDAREIFQVIQGKMLVFIQDNPFELIEGSMLVVDPGEKHRFINPENRECLFIYTLLQC